MTNQMDVYPDRGYAVVILSNYDCEVRHMSMLFREWLAAGADGRAGGNGRGGGTTPPRRHDGVPA